MSTLVLYPGYYWTEIDLCDGSNEAERRYESLSICRGCVHFINNLIASAQEFIECENEFRSEPVPFGTHDFGNMDPELGMMYINPAWYGCELSGFNNRNSTFNPMKETESVIAHSPSEFPEEAVSECVTFGCPHYEKDQRVNVYYDYLKSDIWKTKRRRLIEKAGLRCQICGSATNLNVHHITYDRLLHEDDEDLIVLCNSCHEKAHKTDLQRKEQRDG